MSGRRKGPDPRVVLHNLCRDFEIPARDVPQGKLTRIRLRTRTREVNTAIRFDDDLTAIQHYTPLAQVRPKERGAYAKLAMRNPPREVTPVLNAEGLAGIQGAKSNLPRSRAGLEATYLDVFGRISRYVDDHLPEIIRKLEKR